MKKHKIKLGASKIIALGFLCIILIGSLLLMLPVSTRTGQITPFVDCLFTASSATCVTGLAVYDTFTHWSFFGQIVILSLIQIGGLGFMSIVTMISVIIGRNIGLGERKLIMESTASFGVGGIVGLVKRIVIRTLIAELCGAVLLAFKFCKEMGLIRGIYYSVFHAVSAFCNAGFDLMGRFLPSSSLSRYRTDVYVNVIIMLLIVVGGLGFIVWDDIIKNKWHFSKYQLHSKIVLVATGILIFLPAALFFVFEYNSAFAGETTGNKILMSFFSSITPRTAGFSTFDLNALSDSGSLLTVILMVVGGNSGSTAGGMKVTTLAVLLLALFAAAAKNKDTVVFKKKIDSETIRNASAIFVIYTNIVLIFTMVICAIESFDLKQVLFEVASAIGTVGLSLGITSQLCVASKMLISFLMFAGRLGGLTVIILFAEKSKPTLVTRPTGKVLIG